MTTRRPAVLFYVQHLLGIGHVFRATRVAGALADAGFPVHLVWGGTRIPGMDLSRFSVTWLEPLRAGEAAISSLVRADGAPADQALLDQRRKQLLALLHDLRPGIVITETFPFGRRQMRFELIPLLEAARAASWKPMTVSSVRDIQTENRKQKRVDETLAGVHDWFDLVLVHGDPTMITLEDTLPGAERIAEKIRYTGLVTPPPPDLSRSASVEADVVVSAGGGAVGHALTEAAIGANSLSKNVPGNWLLITGSERSQADFEVLRARAGNGMRVERFVPDLTRVLADARVSVSRPGYNTIGDLLRARCRSILVPFTGGRETEQLRRAELFADRGLAMMLRDENLNPTTLARAVDEAAKRPTLQADVDMEGATNSARIIAQASETFQPSPF